MGVGMGECVRQENVDLGRGENEAAKIDLFGYNII